MFVRTPAILNSAERLQHPRDRSRRGRDPTTHELRQHRIVVARHLHAGARAPNRAAPTALPAAAAPRSRPSAGAKPASGSSAQIRHSIAWPRWTRPSCAERQRQARRDPDLLLDDVDAGRELRDRMLDLEARVHLEEVESAALIDEELDRAGVRVADRGRDLQRRRAHPGALLGRHAAATATPRSPSGAAAAPSTRARTGARACRASRRRPGPRRAAAARSPSRRRRPRRRTQLKASDARPLERRRELGRAGDDADSLAAAAGRRLEHQRESDLARDLVERRGLNAVGARDHRDAGGARGLAAARPCPPSPRSRRPRVR